MLTSKCLDQILTRIPTLTVGVLGDLFLDRYLDLDANLTEPSLETGLDAYQVVRQSMPTLVDEVAVDPAELHGAACAVPGVQGAWAIRSRQAASQRFAELTIAVDGGATVTEGHAVADAVEEALRARYGLTEVVVHVEPC